MHRVHAEHLPATLAELNGEPFIIDGPEAEHAMKVKRLVGDDRVQILDGRGGVATARVLPPSGGGARSGKRGFELRLDVTEIRRVERVRPRVHVVSATPKGSRVDEMIDQLAQVGVWAWSPLATARGVVDPRDSKLSRLERIARESSKQSGRAWDLELGDRVEFAQAIDAGFAARVVGDGRSGREAASSTARIVIADASGSVIESAELRGWRGDSIRLLVGPEGGFTPQEMRLAMEAGARVARFGPQVMRIETAAVVAAGVLMSLSES